MATITSTCRTCRCEFHITESAAAYFRSQHLAIPTRCRPCRALRRQIKEEGDAEVPCSDCGAKFVLVVSEQLALIQADMRDRPVRCPSCRQVARERRAEEKRAKRMERKQKPETENVLVVGRARCDLLDFLTTIPGATRITENPDGTQTEVRVVPGPDTVQ